MGTHHQPETLEVWMQITEKGRKKLATIMAVQERSARSLAKDVGWASHTILLRILNGTQTTITPDKATAIAATLGVGMDDLFVPRASSNARQISKHSGRKVAA